jgi:hypothetical protein
VRANVWLEGAYAGVQEARREYPKFVDALQPRVIVPPNGYPHPKWFTVHLYSQIVAGMQRSHVSQAGCASVLSTLKLVQLSVPTYFIEERFAQAVAATSPPTDMPLESIKWPMDQMLFVLPPGFAKAHFGWNIRYLSIGRHHKGRYPGILMKDLPKVDFDWMKLIEIINPEDRFVVWFTMEAGADKVPIDFTSSYQMSKVFEDTLTFGKFSDSTSKDVEEHPERYGVAPNEKEEVELSAKVNSFAVSLLMAMTARPELVENGGMIRKRSEKKGRVKPELWHPNVVGRAYRIIRSPGTEAQGTHASPRMHWRRGHFRHQKFGLGWAQTKVIWIEPVLVNAGGSV